MLKDAPHEEQRTSMRCMFGWFKGSSLADGGTDYNAARRLLCKRQKSLGCSGIGLFAPARLT